MGSYNAGNRPANNFTQTRADNPEGGYTYDGVNNFETFANKESHEGIVKRAFFEPKVLDRLVEDVEKSDGSPETQNFLENLNKHKMQFADESFHPNLESDNGDVQIINDSPLGKGGKPRGKPGKGGYSSSNPLGSNSRVNIRSI